MTCEIYRDWENEQNNTRIAPAPPIYVKIFIRLMQYGNGRVSAAEQHKIQTTNNFVCFVELRICGDLLIWINDIIGRSISKNSIRACLFCVCVRLSGVELSTISENDHEHCVAVAVEVNKNGWLTLCFLCDPTNIKIMVRYNLYILIRIYCTRLDLSHLSTTHQYCSSIFALTRPFYRIFHIIGATFCSEMYIQNLSN